MNYSEAHSDDERNSHFEMSLSVDFRKDGNADNTLYVSSMCMVQRTVLDGVTRRHGCNRAAHTHTATTVVLL